MNKVLQAAGRVIRTKEDKGVILLLDDRFWDRDYQEIFPREWQGKYRLQAGYGRRCSGDVLEEVYLTERRNPIYL